MIIELTGIQGNKLLFDVNLLHCEEITEELFPALEGATRILSPLLQAIGWVHVKETTEEIKEQIKRGGINATT